MGSKHIVWKDTEQNRVVKATGPGYLTDGSVIVTSQSWQEPTDASSLHPSVAEMIECMQGFGFSQIHGNDWQHASGVVARNVKPSDFIKTRDGVVPIDIDLSKP